jgi:hypothetical protein
VVANNYIDTWFDGYIYVDGLVDESLDGSMVCKIS